MEGKNRNRLIVFLLLALCGPLSSAQTQKSQTDSLVRLMKAQSLELIERFGIKYRKAIDATFLHNGTYLICDTALWNVDMRVIHADGHVQVIQDETKLTSDKLVYFIDDDLAQFRGTLVQLQNKKKNILRTRFLDYNTRDSIAVFKDGGAMRDEDGQIIESWNGSYDSRRKEFLFSNNVNMFTDSVFVKTESLTYESDANRAVFNSHIDFWKGGNMLSAGQGWYLRPEETFFFTDDVHGFSEEQEAWCDSLYFYRKPNDILMRSRAQIQDTTRHVAAVADYVYYSDSLSQITLCRRATVALKTQEKDKVDTIYFGADTLVYRTIPRCDIPAETVRAAEGRVAEMYVDPVAEYRKKAAQEAAQAKEAARAEMNPGRTGGTSRAPGARSPGR
ncbi:MAG: hypothetical protein J5871_03340, partial [Bacteroidales bacterium]|nr:hypothetical protein [Bacteroidales bacterium]